MIVALSTHRAKRLIDTALGLGAIGHLGGNFRELCTVAADNAPDQRGQGRPMPHHMPLRHVWLALEQGLVYGTIAAEVVAHDVLLSA